MARCRELGGRWGLQGPGTSDPGEWWGLTLGPSGDWGLGQPRYPESCALCWDATHVPPAFLTSRYALPPQLLWLQL